MEGIIFLLIAVAVLSACAGGWMKQFWPLAVGIILIAAALLLKGVRL